MRRRIGAEAQPERRALALEFVQDDPGLDGRRGGIGVDPHHLIEVAFEINHDPRADRVTGDRRTPAAWGERNSSRAGDLDRGRDLVGVAGEYDDLGYDPVVGGVAGVFGAASGGVVHRPDPGAT